MLKTVKTGQTVQTSNGRNITLEEKPFKSGGEGGIFKIVYPSEDKDKCVKLYLQKNRGEEKENKILHMVQKPPTPIKGDDYIVCWPSEVIYQNGKFTGFLMPLAFDDSIETVDMVLLKLRKDLPDKWRAKYNRSEPNSVLARLKICVNIAYALQAIHSKGIYTMVDMKPQNILITDVGKVSIIDIDSIQIADNNKQVIHHAQVFTPEYAPPEHKHLTLQRDYIPLSWDRFSAAVMFYQILFGIHPYVATFDDKYKDCDTIEKCIENGLFVHGSNKKYISALLPPPHNSFKDIPQTLQGLFVRAFENGHSDPQERPTIDKWGHNIYKIVIEPQLAISKTNFDFSNLRVGATASGSFSISNIGSGTLSGTIKTNNKKWLKLTQSSFDITQHKQDITFSIDTSSLHFGFKDTGTIEVQSNGGTKVVTVNLSVEEIPQLAINKTNFDFYIMQKNSYISPGRFTLSNDGGGTLSGVITTNKDWLKLTQSNFNNITQHKQEDIKFYIDTSYIKSCINTFWLLFGFKDTGTIEIQSNGGTEVVTVNLSIEAEITDSTLSRFRWQFIPAFAVIVGLVVFLASKSIGSAFVGVLLSLAISPFLSKLALCYRYSTDKNVMIPLWAIAGVLLLIMIVIGVLPQESSREQFTVTAYKDVNANVRTAPSMSAEILDVLEIQKGETLGILEVKGNWYKIETIINGKDKVGWIYKGLVVSSEPKPEAPSQEARPELTPPSPPIARTESEPTKPPVDIARGDVDLYIDRGLAYGRRGRYNEAISDFDKAIQINPRHAEAYYNRGVIYYIKGLYNEAISDFRKACDMGDKEGCELVNQKQRAQ